MAICREFPYLLPPATYHKTAVFLTCYKHLVFTHLLLSISSAKWFPAIQKHYFEQCLTWTSWRRGMHRASKRFLVLCRDRRTAWYRATWKPEEMGLVVCAVSVINGKPDRVSRVWEIVEQWFSPSPQWGSMASGDLNPYVLGRSPTSSPLHHIDSPKFRRKILLEGLHGLPVGAASRWSTLFLCSWASISFTPDHQDSQLSPTRKLIPPMCGDGTSLGLKSRQVSWTTQATEFFLEQESGRNAPSLSFLQQVKSGTGRVKCYMADPTFDPISCMY